VRVGIILSSSVVANPELFGAWVRATLQALVLTNRWLIQRAGGRFPGLYRAGVRFRREPDGEETFRDCANVLRRGGGDCAHLCAWRVAELQERGEAAGVRVQWPNTRKRPRVFHVQVRRASGAIEDPSRLLGM